jgi:tetraacyldisaccharide-1-P 4'-kinase
LTGLPTDAPIVVTEKDAVKIRALALPSTTLERVFVLSVSAALEPCVLTDVLAHVQRINHHD